mmetsp:Transcript_23145/g.49533  ORF Transcript_23145/g.49533 Transcript_23145/m.49533 type:complete len:381 (+) Transcript_23145:600-1742(+)
MPEAIPQQVSACVALNHDGGLGAFLQALQTVHELRPRNVAQPALADMHRSGGIVTPLLAAPSSGVSAAQSLAVGRLDPSSCFTLSLLLLPLRLPGAGVLTALPASVVPLHIGCAPDTLLLLLALVRCLLSAKTEQSSSKCTLNHSGSRHHDIFPLLCFLAQLSSTDHFLDFPGLVMKHPELLAAKIPSKAPLNHTRRVVSLEHQAQLESPHMALNLGSGTVQLVLAHCIRPPAGLDAGGRHALLQSRARVVAGPQFPLPPRFLDPLCRQSLNKPTWGRCLGRMALSGRPAPIRSVILLLRLCCNSISTDLLRCLPLVRIVDSHSFRGTLIKDQRRQVIRLHSAASASSGHLHSLHQPGIIHHLQTRIASLLPSCSWLGSC